MINHVFESGLPDDGDPTKVQGTHWDDDHVITDAAAVRTALGLATVASSASAADLSAGILPGARMPNLTGDVTTSEGTVATTIANDAVTYAKIQNVSATSRVLGRITAGAGDVEEVTVAQLLTMLGVTIGHFGDGSHGTHTMDGAAAVTNCSLAGSVYTAQGACFFDALTLNNGVTLKPDGWPIFFKVPPTINGLVDSSGGDAAGTVDGAAAVGGTRRLPVSLGIGNASTNAPQVFSNSGGGGGATAGGAGTNGAAGTAGVIGRGGGGGAGGNNNPFTAQGASGAASPTVTLATAANGDIREPQLALRGSNHAAVQFTPGTAGGAGGAGGSGTTGGGRGAAGGWMVLCAPGFLGSGTIRAKGGNGGAGTAGGAGIGGAGGGGGGAGGLAVLVTAGGGVVPTVDVSGGAAGAGGGGGSGGAGSGGDGAAGGAGYALVI
jgi:hypothetical protein